MQAKSKLRLTARQRKAAILLAEGDHSVSSIAKKVGLDRTTLHKWKKRPDFQALANQIQEDAVTAASAKLASLFVEALHTYEQLLRSKSERIRLAAADRSLDHFPGFEMGPCTAEEIIAHRNETDPAYLDEQYALAVQRALRALGHRDLNPHVAAGSVKADVSGTDAETVDAKS